MRFLMLLLALPLVTAAPLVTVDGQEDWQRVIANAHDADYLLVVPSDGTELDAFVRALFESDDNIRAVLLAEESVGITYEQEACLFGMQRNYLMHATIDAGGAVRMEYPWWVALVESDAPEIQQRLLARAPQTRRMTGLARTQQGLLVLALSMRE